MTVRAVYDCMLFFVQAARPERTRETFELLRDKQVLVFVSAETLAQIRDVLERPEYRHKFPALTDQAVAAFLNELASLTQFVSVVPRVYTLERDPKDSKYIDLALATEAEYLVTRDKDLLDLMNQTTPQGSDFRRRFPNLRIVDPQAFVRIAKSLHA